MCLCDSCASFHDVTRVLCVMGCCVKSVRNTSSGSQYLVCLSECDKPAPVYTKRKQHRLERKFLMQDRHILELIPPFHGYGIYHNDTIPAVVKTPWCRFLEINVVLIVYPNFALVCCPAILARIYDGEILPCNL